MEMNILKYFENVFREINDPKIPKNIRRLENLEKSFENAQRNAFFGKAADLQFATLSKNKLHYKYFQLICLPFKRNCL